MENNNSTTLPSFGGSSEFMNELSQMLLSQSGSISSSSSDIESSITSAISGVESAATSSNLALESQFGRESGYLLEQASQNAIAGRAAGSGGLMNMAALRELTSTTDKNLNDLEQRKQELILQNNASAASKIADLQLKALEFRQQAQQKIFDNLLGLGGLGLQMQQEERLQQAQNFTERSAIASIGLQYGVTVGANDTIESVVAKAMPMASKIQQAELAKLTSEIKYNNAKIAEIEAGTAANYDPYYAASAIAKIKTDPNLTEEERAQKVQAIMSNVGPGNMAAVYEEEAKMIQKAYEPETLKNKYTAQLSSGYSYDSILQSINSNIYIGPQDKAMAIKQLNAAKSSTSTNRGYFNGFSSGKPPMSPLIGAALGTAGTVNVLPGGNLMSSLFNFYNR